MFLFENKELKDIGSLNVGVEESDGVLVNVVSVVPYTIIKKMGDSIIFHFTKDVVYDPGGRGDRLIKKGKLKYVYEDGELKEVR